MEAVPGGSLYVGDLHPEVNEVQLWEFFRTIGLISSLRICRDSVTHRSLCYAYVNYKIALDAIRALDTLNYLELNGKPIRIMWSTRDPSIRRTGMGNVFIKNLHQSIDSKVLHDTFARFGRILSCKVVMEDCKSKGYGFVNFESQEDADAAIKNVNGMLIEGKKVYVGKFIRKTERTSSSRGEPKFTNVFIKNLDPIITEEVLTQKFSEFGKILSNVIMKNENNESKGFGFINFENTDDAMKAVEEMNGAQLGSKTIFVGRAQKRAEREIFLREQFEEKRLERFQRYKECNLYIKNLDAGVDDDYLCKQFAIYGTIVSAKVMRDERGFSRGFGFVCYNTPEQARKAMAEAQGRLIFNTPIFIAMAQRKEVRRVQLEQLFAQRKKDEMLHPGCRCIPLQPNYYMPPGFVPPSQQMPGMQQMGWRHPTESLAPPGAVWTRTMTITQTPPGATIGRNGQVPQQQQPFHQAPHQQQALHQAPHQQPPLHQAPYQQLPLNQSPNQQPPLNQAPNQQPQLHLVPNQKPPLHQTPSKDAKLNQIARIKKIKQILNRMDSFEPMIISEQPESQYSMLDQAVNILHQHLKSFQEGRSSVIRPARKIF